MRTLTLLSIVVVVAVFSSNVAEKSAHDAIEAVTGHAPVNGSEHGFFGKALEGVKHGIGSTVEKVKNFFHHDNGTHSDDYNHHNITSH